MASRYRNITVKEWNDLVRRLRRVEGAIENIYGELNLIHDKLDVYAKTFFIDVGRALPEDHKSKKK